MTSFLCWFEIPAVDLHRAVRFYSEVLRVDIEIVTILGHLHGILPRKGTYAGGAIVAVNEPITQGASPVLFFKVNDMTSSLESVTMFGGSVVNPKTIMRREGTDGKTMIPETLIDGKQGYFAIVRDSEGNKIALYSNA
jgi:uncharacterized protein